MKKNTTVKSSRKTPQWAAVGIDLGDRTSLVCGLDEKAQIVTEFKIPTTPEALRAKFQRRPTQIALEAGPHAVWIEHLLTQLGHTVTVANPRQLRLISHSAKKTDRADAITLARLALCDATLLSPIQVRDPQRQMHLTMVRARAKIVAVRTELLNSARGLVKPHGVRLPRRDASSPQALLAQGFPPDLQSAIHPMLVQVDTLSEQIKVYDQQLAEIAATHYPETAKLRKVRGVGLIVALTYVLVIADPTRFRRSRQVGCYTGTTPRRNDSGQRNPQLGITKHGDAYLRAMLNQSAQFILGPLGEDCDLRRWGLRLCERGGKNAKKRAVTAVSRKLAVLMHRLWISDQPYDRFYNSGQTQPAVA